jgi:hypothetical protein
MQQLSFYNGISAYTQILMARLDLIANILLERMRDRAIRQETGSYFAQTGSPYAVVNHLIDYRIRSLTPRQIPSLHQMKFVSV